MPPSQPRLPKKCATSKTPAADVVGVSAATANRIPLALTVASSDLGTGK
jgi:hypothetical protein